MFNVIFSVHIYNIQNTYNYIKKLFELLFCCSWALLLVCSCLHLLMFELALCFSVFVLPFVSRFSLSYYLALILLLLFPNYYFLYPCLYFLICNSHPISSFFSSFLILLSSLFHFFVCSHLIFFFSLFSSSSLFFSLLLLFTFFSFLLSPISVNCFRFAHSNCCCHLSPNAASKTFPQYLAVPLITLHPLFRLTPPLPLPLWLCALVIKCLWLNCIKHA